MEVKTGVEETCEVIDAEQMQCMPVRLPRALFRKDSGMNRLFVLTLLCCSSCSSTPKHGQALYIQTPHLYPVANYSTKIFDEAFFKEDHFAYASNSHEADTTKYFYNSETSMIEGTVRRFLRNCTAVAHYDSLLLQLNDIPFSANPYDLTVVKSKNRLDVTCHQSFSITDSSYKAPRFRTINENIILDQMDYAKGDSLKGKISVEVAASYFWENKYTDTTHVYGLIKTVVQ